MMFIKITPVYRRGASSPPETGRPELLRIDLIQRVAFVSPAGADMPCVKLTLDGGGSIDCTGTVNDLIAVLSGPAEEFYPDSEVQPEPDDELPDDEPSPGDSEHTDRE